MGRQPWALSLPDKELCLRSGGCTQGPRTQGWACTPHRLPRNSQVRQSVPHNLANSPKQTDMDGTSKETGPVLPPPDVEKLSPGEGKELVRALRELVAELGLGPQLEACPEQKSLPPTCSQSLLLVALAPTPPTLSGTISLKTSKRLPDWASLELSPSVESCGCGLGPSPVRLG